MIKIRKPYSKRNRVMSVPVGESKTQQHLKDEVNVNNIIAKHARTGIVEHVARTKARYGDFTIVNEYQEALERVSEAQSNFYELPSSIRKEFDNDPGKFIEFVTNPENKDKMIDMGLAYPDPVVDTAPAKSTAEPAPAEPNPPA